MVKKVPGAPAKKTVAKVRIVKNGIEPAPPFKPKKRGNRYV